MSTNNDQNNCDVHLHAEIEVLKQALVEKQNQLISMETACLRESDRQAELEDSIIAWQDKYDRLYESHKRVQKVNQSLEDKLLKLVDRNSGERAQLTSDVATLSVRLAQANYNIAKLQREIERYKTDINLAIQLLQCKPDSFVPQKVSSLPMDIQSKVSSYMRLETNSHSDSEGSTSGIGVATSGSYKVLPASDSPPPICPFPPTAMVYSMRGLDAQNSECNESSEQIISPSIMAKYLEDELKSSEIKHCDTCKCSNKDLTVLADEPKTYSIGTQTILQGDSNSSLCLRCNSNLNSPSRTNSPYIMKLVKSSDSVISETKSSVSDFNDADKLFTPAKKDDLMVNPILGHHRLCERTINTNKQMQSSSLSIINNNSHPLQINSSDTAKYLIESHHNNSNISNSNHKNDDDHDLIDLNKFSNTINASNSKSPKMAVNNDITSNSSAFNSHNQQLSDTNKLINNNNNINNASRNSDSINLLIDNIENNNGIVQGKTKSDNPLGSNEKQIENNGNNGNTGNGSVGGCNSMFDKGNLQTSVTGSTNSLWSKTSSGEGAKIFENFNKNLIKTIKAENPKYRGPRLCALRIQNGSSNILLDSIESELTPILYTRRQRFLDEELDDTKDIITSKNSMAESPNSPVNNNSTLNELGTALETPLSPNKQNPNDNIKTTIDSKDNIENKSQKNGIINSMVMISAQPSIQNDFQTITDGKLGTINCLDQQQKDLNSLNSIVTNEFSYQQQQHQQQQCSSSSIPNYDMITLCDNSLNSSFKNTNSKSCTQSSSLSSNCIDAVDLQENALLRRQQLTRVAEWVQNNSQMEQTACTQNSHKMLNTQNNNNNSIIGILNSNNNCNNNNKIPNDIKHEFQNNKSITSNEELSNNNDFNNYKSKTQQLTNGICNAQQQQTIKNQITINSLNNAIPNSITTANIDDNKFIDNYQYPYLNNESIAQNNYTMNRKYYNDENNKNLLKIQQEHQHHQQSKQLNGDKDCQENDKNFMKKECSNQSLNQVDLAQMEYNVKQFLLKQNEWSIRNKSKASSSGNTSNTNSNKIQIASNYNKNNNSNTTDNAIVKCHPHRTETNL